MHRFICLRICISFASLLTGSVARGGSPSGCGAPQRHSEAPPCLQEVSEVSARFCPRAFLACAAPFSPSPPFLLHGLKARRAKERREGPGPAMPRGKRAVARRGEGVGEAVSRARRETRTAHAPGLWGMQILVFFFSTEKGKQWCKVRVTTCADPDAKDAVPRSRGAPRHFPRHSPYPCGVSI